MSRLQRNILPRDALFLLRNSDYRPETSKRTFHQSRVLSGSNLWKCLGEIKLANIQNDSTAETNENTHTPQLKQKNDVESQTTSLNKTSLHNLEPLRNSSKKMKPLANQYCASISPRTVRTKPKKRLTTSQLKCNGVDNNSLLTKTTSPLFGKRLSEMRHGRALYISVLHLSS